MALSVTNLGIDGLEDIEQIGTGGSSRVYKARQSDLDRVVAVKVLNTADDQDVVRRFDRERKAMGRLSLHEGIVPVYSSGVTDHGEPYLVMPYYPSGSLQDQIETGAMDWPTAVRYVEAAADTIAAAHDEGVVHLDLKPANILLTVKGAPRIADFGIARLLTGSTAARTNGNAAFTPAYSAPETFLEGETGPASDVYGLGATLWALLVGHPPFLTPGNDNNLMSVIGRVVNNPVGDLREFTPGPICDVIERAMAKQPSMRYQTAREFATALKDSSDASMGGNAPAPPTQVSPAAPPVGVGGVYDDPTRPASALFPQQPGHVDIDATNVLGGPELPASLASTVAPADPAPARPLLEETAQPMVRPAGPPPLAPNSPMIDLDRIGFGPILIGGAVFVAVILAAIFVLTGGDDGDGSTTVTNPAAPSSTDTTLSPSEVDPNATASSSPLTTTPTSSLESSLPAPTPSLTAPTTAPTTAATTATSSATTTTEQATTTSAEVTSTTGTSAPAPVEPPTGLTATPSADSVALSWTAPSGGTAPTAYQVLRDGTVIGPSVSGTSFTDTDVSDGATYIYTVRSVGATAADTSAPSSPVSATVSAPLEFTKLEATGSFDRIEVNIEATKCVVYEVQATPVGDGEPRGVNGPPTSICSATHVVALARPTAGAEYDVEVKLIFEKGKPQEETVTDTVKVTIPSTGSTTTSTGA